MASSNLDVVTLEDDDLNDWDRHVLDYLHEGRATPGLIRKMLLRDDVTDSISRQYINGRMTRLEEHGHLENIEESGVYELVNDPRDDGHDHAHDNAPAVADGGFVRAFAAEADGDEWEPFDCPECDGEIETDDELRQHARECYGWDV